MTRASGALRLQPFRALRYPPEPAQGRDRHIAPPYDVITPAQRERLAGHPHNIVHLDLPEAAPGSDPYARAAETLRSWVRDGVLRRDPRPAFYLCEQRYQGPDGLRRRRGLFARLALESYDAGVVIPHERTLERPRLDRRRLLEATRTHLSAVFMLHPDPGAQVSRLLAEEVRKEPVLEAEDADGIGHRLVRLDEAGVVGRIEDLFRDQWALIADGHHRYESALAYRDARRAEGARDAEHILAFLCSLEDEGLIVLPIHRLIHSLPGFSAQRTIAAMADWFDLQPVEDPRRLGAAVGAMNKRPGVFGLVFGAGGGAFVACWKEGAGLDRPVMGAVPEPLRRLDVILLHRLVLEDVLGIDSEAQSRQAHIEYVKDEALLLQRAADAQMAVLLNPTRIEQVVEVGRAGLRLPQKTTYFQPKVPSGLVIDSLDG